MITEAVTDPERREVQELFESIFSDIDPAAVPPVRANGQYAPIVLRYQDPETGQLLGAALTCRAQVAAMAVLTSGQLPAPIFGRSGPPIDFAPVLDRHSELDLMGVAQHARGRGIGSALIATMEHSLRERGVRAWFGNATADLDTAQLRRFYSQHGFTVLDDGVPLPPLLGRPWVPAGAGPTAFFFYKILS